MTLDTRPVAIDGSNPADATARGNPDDEPADSRSAAAVGRVTGTAIRDSRPVDRTTDHRDRHDRSRPIHHP